MKREKLIRSVLILFAALVVLGLLSNRRGEALMAASTVSSSRCIVIDPGHGGEDGGTTGVSGTGESALNLEIGLRLRALLCLLGQEPVMVRETDISIYSEGTCTLSEKKISDLHNRAALIAETPGAVVLSIHQNYFPEAKYRGAQVFYAPTEGSRALATELQSLLKCLDGTNNRSTKQVDKGVYLMNHIEATGVLIECGFLSNPEEEALLCSADYQKKLAAVIAAATLQYLEDTNEV